MSFRTELHDYPPAFWGVMSFCDFKTIVAIQLVCRRFNELAVADTPWRELLIRMNLKPLMDKFFCSSPPMMPLRDFFLTQILTGRVLHGHYTFNGDKTDPLYTIMNVVLVIGPGFHGQRNHQIARVHILITYRNTSEVIHGIVRFSILRRTFVFCCSVVGSSIRGPVFTVTVATVNKRWANQTVEEHAEHQRGLRLILAPLLVEGKSKGSQVTENDVICVSQPPTTDALSPVRHGRT